MRGGRYACEGKVICLRVWDNEDKINAIEGSKGKRTTRDCVQCKEEGGRGGSDGDDGSRRAGPHERAKGQGSRK